MNPLLNPLVAIPFLKNYLMDPNRLNRLSPQQLDRYRDRAFRKIISYAATVPLYQEKYTTGNISPKDFHTLHDIIKHPFISKQDLIDNFPNKIIPRTYNKEHAHVVCTGGSTGKPVSIYVDFGIMLRAIGPVLAQMRYYKMNLRTIRMAHIGNFNRYRIDSVVQNNFLPQLRHVYSMENALNIDVNTPVKDIINRLNSYKPDLIISYPALFQHLAFLKKKGFGEQVEPKLIQVGGDILDEYTRRYVEDAFGCPMRNIYPSVEAQASIAFECLEKNWHLHADFFHLEAMNEQREILAPGERGHLIITRLWGQATPIIRYTGMDDWITLSDNEHCSCGLKSVILKKPVEGRMKANIVLPNGKVFPPGAFCFIEPVLHDLHTFKVKQYQIIQKKINEIEITLAIDEDQRTIGPSFDQIAVRIKDIYQQKTGPEVTITVVEVSEIPADPKSGKPAPIVLSHVSKDEGFHELDKAVS
jgi:phenylacetate-CoA ligase